MSSVVLLVAEKIATNVGSEYRVALAEKSIESTSSDICEYKRQVFAPWRALGMGDGENARGRRQLPGRPADPPGGVLATT